jgi:hypothetical protein
MGWGACCGYGVYSHLRDGSARIAACSSNALLQSETREEKAIRCDQSELLGAQVLVAWAALLSLVASEGTMAGMRG